ncbi:peptidylprolyl isomerase [Gordonia sp. VNK21]|uniref:peptidylprolyl isomerase n=1 Tax=Gordonia sp. VNK21 TaxID=3382483 RepID=UPI0038D3F87E
MSTNEERREAAKRKLEERLEAERQQAHRRRVVIGSVSGVVVLAVLVTAGFFSYRAWDNSRHVTCDYQAAPVEADKVLAAVQEQVKSVEPNQKQAADEYLAEFTEGLKKLRTSHKPDDRVLKEGDAQLQLATNKGDVTIKLDRSKAPCNVNAMISLANDGYYDGATCNRLMMQQGLGLLMCGDPTGTGAGGPGWNSPDETPDFLETVPADPQMAQLGLAQENAKYPRGTVVIANNNNEQSGTTDTGNANFYIVTADTELPPSMSVVGSVDEAGMKIVDEVVKGGTQRTAGGTEQAGRPNVDLTITKTSVSD